MVRPEHPAGRPVSRTAALALALLLSIGCAGVKPNPTYTRRSSPPKSARPAEKKSGRREAAARRGDKLDSEVRRWWGTPYRWGGARRGSGVDCSAYTRAVMRSVYGVKLPRTSVEQFRVGLPVTRGRLRRGDLVFFNINGRGVSHVGIYLGGGKFTHASNSDGVTIDKLSSPYYRKRYVGARRVLR